MKKVEAVVRSELAKKVVDEISKQGVGGVTLIQSLGKGSGERPWLGGEKGHQVEFNALDVIITVIEDSQLDSVVSAISDTAHTGEKGDGKIFVSEISDVYDITTKEKKLN